MYTFRKEHKETDYLRPRWIPEGEGVEAGLPLKALINLETKKLCWGIVDQHDNYIAENQQLQFNPWTGLRLPATVEELKKTIAR